jgi:Lrp/AsnC family leucine-responsive transcriptional regulator
VTRLERAGAVIRIRPAAQQLRKIPEVARDRPEVVACARITGEDRFPLKLRLRAIEDLEEIIDRFVLFGQATSIVGSSPVARRPLQLPLDA